MVGEGLLFSVLLIALPFVSILAPTAVLVGVLLDQVLFLAVTLLVARRERRVDVLLAFPLFIIPRILNALVFTWAFLAERRPREMQWFSVARY